SFTIAEKHRCLALLHDELAAPLNIGGASLGPTMYDLLPAVIEEFYDGESESHVLFCYLKRQSLLSTTDTNVVGKSFKDGQSCPAPNVRNFTRYHVAGYARTDYLEC